MAYIGESVGSDSTGGKLIIWGLLSLLVPIALQIVLTLKAKADMDWRFTLAGVVLMLLIGAYINWIPAWIAVIIIVATVLAVVEKATGAITGAAGGGNWG
jgi:hypothetical protein